MPRTTDASRPPGATRKRRVRLPLLGWREWVALPELGVVRIKVKLDTGARTSSLHVSDLERFREGRKHMVRFTLHPIQRSALPTIQCEAEVLEERRVRSSNGHVAMRPVIETTMEVLGRSCRIEVTLASRDQMGFRMLLGRSALRKRFDVSPGRSFLSDAPGPIKRRVKKRVKKGLKKRVKKRKPGS